MNAHTNVISQIDRLFIRLYLWRSNLTYNDLLEYVGSLFAIIGAWLLSINHPISSYGFVLFLISNVFLIAFAIRSHHPGLLCMYGILTYTSMNGIVNWLLR